jgi:hypothetical protein
LERPATCPVQHTKNNCCSRRTLERPATYTVQHTKHNCCSRSGRVASAWTCVLHATFTTLGGVPGVVRLQPLARVGPTCRERMPQCGPTDADTIRAQVASSGGEVHRVRVAVVGATAELDEVAQQPRVERHGVALVVQQLDNALGVKLCEPPRRHEHPRRRRVAEDALGVRFGGVSPAARTTYLEGRGARTCGACTCNARARTQLAHCAHAARRPARACAAS